jgi:Domain of unknown function (DUF4124)
MYLSNVVISMTGRTLRIACITGALLLISCLTEPLMAAKLFRWVDQDGEVHYGDRVPPNEVKLDREELNKYGVTVRALSHELTQQERETLKRQQAIEAAEQQRILAASLRDNVLLSTYLSIGEIEALRNRRKELLDGQIKVTELYLSNLQEKVNELQKDASRFQPYNPDPNAPPIPNQLAKELSNSLKSILVYDQTLADTRDKKFKLVSKFNSDIDRFQHLKTQN